MIYLDNAATTFPKPECVYRAVDEFSRTSAVNAGRGAYKKAREAGVMIRDVRRELQNLCDAREQSDVVLTYSVTVALNEIILGQPWKEGSVAYVSPYEHNAVLRPLNLLRKRLGIIIRELPLADDLSIDLEAAKKAFEKEPPAFVSVTGVSNVTGYVLPAREIFLMAREYGAFTLMDGAQAVGLIPLHFGPLLADALTFAGHKTLYATFGVAGFILKEGANFSEVITGGNGVKSLSMDMPPYPPEKFESSSLSTPAIAGLQASLMWLRTADPLKRERELMDYLLPRLEDIPGITLYAAPGGPENQAGVISLNKEGFKANELAAVLDERWDIAVRAGHHCAALIHDHLKDASYDGTLRVSLSAFTTEEELDILLDALRQADRSMIEGIPDDILRGNC